MQIKNKGMYVDIFTEGMRYQSVNGVVYQGFRVYFDSGPSSWDTPIVPEEIIKAIDANKAIAI